MLIEGRLVAGRDALTEPGDFCFAGHDFLNGHAERKPSEYSALLLNCPECGSYHAIPIKPGNPQGWGWNGNVERPTLTPSIWFEHGHVNNDTCRWHGYLENGAWRST